MNLYSYANSKPIEIAYSSSSARGSDSGMIDSLTLGCFFDGSSSVGGNGTVPCWIQTLVGAIPDILLGAKYLNAKGIHTKFAYATNTRYMHPIMGKTWRWFGKSESVISNFETIAQGSFKQILTGDAKAGFRAIAKSVFGTVGLNLGVNAIFNLYESNWNYKDVDMWIDTGIDTAIGVSSYYLATGTMSLVTAGVVAAGFAMPGIVVIGGVVLLSIGFEWLIREISNYHQ